MISSTARRRLFQSSARTTAADRLRKRCGKRNLRPSLVNVGTTSPPPLGGFYETYSRSLAPLRVFFSTETRISDHRKHCHRYPRFEELDLHPRTLKALRRQGIHRQTEVQSKTFDDIRTGRNVVARSRTGTGKTLAFLIPTLERYLAQDSSTKWGIPILILAPTRELAAQIGKEAEKLVDMHKHNDKISSQVVYGGSSKQEDISKFQKGLPTILVATPGRLKDHLATTTLTHHSVENDESDSCFGKQQQVPFRSALQSGNLHTLILDETDRLLELGFRRDVQDIISCLEEGNNTQANTSRQTLLFSATLSPAIMDVVDLAIGTRNYEMIDCVNEVDLTTHTNAKTSQSYVLLTPERFWMGSMEFIVQLLTEKQNSKKRPKIIVFFELTRLAQLYTKFVSLRLGRTQGVWELHGKMHQRERTLTTRRFRNAPSGVLFTSDVSARGVDYPDVTHVVQVGAPQNRETYIHRLGRTGRAGKDGAGILLLPDHEHDFISEELDGLGLEADDLLQKKLSQKRSSGSVRREIEDELGMLQHDLQNGRDRTGMAESLKLAYHSLVSYFFQTRRQSQSQGKGSSLKSTVTIINQLIQDFGLPELPAIGFQRAKGLGIDHLSGHLNIRKDWEDQSFHNKDSENTNHGDFDDWFGLSSENSPQKQKPRRHKQGNEVDHQSNNSAKEKSSNMKRKKKESRFDDRQRYDAMGEFPK